MIIGLGSTDATFRVVAPFVNKASTNENAVLAILAPEIERRMALWKEYGRDYPDKPVSLG
jgi:hypothetical protein